MKFRKSVKIAPGIKLNFSKSGVTTTVGRRGASVNVGGKRGAKATVGIPGSGLSHEIQLTNGRRASKRHVDADDPDARGDPSIVVVLAWIVGIGVVIAVLRRLFGG